MKLIKTDQHIWSLVLAVFFFINLGCNKYLDKKSQQGFYIPESPKDLQALLDNNFSLNLFSCTGLPEILAGDFYVADNRWVSASVYEKFHYIWSPDALNIEGYSIPYASGIYISNIVLDQIKSLKKSGDEDEVRNIEGSALFFRSFTFFNLAQLFCRPFDSETGKTDLGLVLRLTADVGVVSGRSSVTNTYDQIVGDLLKAVELLPDNSISKMRPNKLTAYALLARVYLSMRDYKNANKYASLALNIKNNLLDFNDLPSVGNSTRLPSFDENPEVIFFYWMKPLNLTDHNVARVDLQIIDIYEEDDLRKIVFFRPNTGSSLGTFRFRGSYYNESPGSYFNGLTIDELYFIKMECMAREGLFEDAIGLLNDFLKKRYRKEVYKEYHASNKEDGIRIVLEERRKELIFRGLRWTDIRRLNLEGANIELTRLVEGVKYVLPPNDKRYALLIPDDEIIRSGILQNPR